MKCLITKASNSGLHHTQGGIDLLHMADVARFQCRVGSSYGCHKSDHHMTGNLHLPGNSLSSKIHDCVPSQQLVCLASSWSCLLVLSLVFHRLLALSSQVSWASIKEQISCP